jgi:hypothetical protein
MYGDGEPLPGPGSMIGGDGGQPLCAIVLGRASNMPCPPLAMPIE